MDFINERLRCYSVMVLFYLKNNANSLDNARRRRITPSSKTRVKNSPNLMLRVFSQQRNTNTPPLHMVLPVTRRILFFDDYIEYVPRGGGGGGGGDGGGYVILLIRRNPSR